MKKTFTLLALALCSVVFTASMSFANESKDVRADYEKAFIQLTENSKTALKEVTTTKSNGSQAKLRIASVPVAGNPTAENPQAPANINSNMAVKVWFEKTDGTCVNPMRKRWDAKEQMYIHIQAAAPIYVAIFQNYPESRPSSRQVYPDNQFPESFKPLQPGQSTKLPVLFELDNDLRDEIISIVVVRADSTSNPSNINSFSASSTTGTATATATADNNGVSAIATNGNQTAIARADNNGVSATATNGAPQNPAPAPANNVTSIGAGTMKAMPQEETLANAEANANAVANANIPAEALAAVNIAKDVNASATANAGNVQVTANATISYAPAESSREPNDVCTYLFGAGEVGQWQLTIKK